MYCVCFIKIHVRLFAQNTSQQTSLSWNETHIDRWSSTYDRTLLNHTCTVLIICIIMLSSDFKRFSNGTVIRCIKSYKKKVFKKLQRGVKGFHTICSLCRDSHLLGVKWNQYCIANTWNQNFWQNQYLNPGISAVWLSLKIFVRGLL